MDDDFDAKLDALKRLAKGEKLPLEEERDLVRWGLIQVEPVLPKHFADFTDAERSIGKAYYLFNTARAFANYNALLRYARGLTGGKRDGMDRILYDSRRSIKWLAARIEALNARHAIHPTARDQKRLAQMDEVMTGARRATKDLVDWMAEVMQRGSLGGGCATVAEVNFLFHHRSFCGQNYADMSDTRKALWQVSVAHVHHILTPPPAAAPAPKPDLPRRTRAPAA